MFKEAVFVIAGEQNPFLSKSKACYARLMQAILMTGAKLNSAHSINSWSEKGDFIACLEIPVRGVYDFVEIAKCSLSWHPDVALGSSVVMSSKWRDSYGEIHREPYEGLPII